MMKKLFCLCLCLVSFLCVLSSCKKDENIIIVGTMYQPGEPILNFVKDKFEEKGYQLKIQLFNNFSLPNDALAEKSIDANLFQHKPFLDNYNEAQHQDLKSVLAYYDCVYGGYTKKQITSVEDIPNGSKITIASDASNLSRCLYILQATGLITLEENIETAMIENIVSNPKNLQIVPVSAELIAQTLDDEDTYLGIVNANYAIAAGLTDKQLICQEADPQHKNANILAVRSEDVHKQWVKDLIEVLTDEETIQFIQDTFKGTIVPYCQRVDN